MSNCVPFKACRLRSQPSLSGARLLRKTVTADAMSSEEATRKSGHLTQDVLINTGGVDTDHAQGGRHMHADGGRDRAVFPREAQDHQSCTRAGKKACDTVPTEPLEGPSCEDSWILNFQPPELSGHPLLLLQLPRLWSSVTAHRYTCFVESWASKMGLYEGWEVKSLCPGPASRDQAASWGRKVVLERRTSGVL